MEDLPAWLAPSIYAGDPVPEIGRRPETHTHTHDSGTEGIYVHDSSQKGTRIQTITMDPMRQDWRKS